MSVRSSTFTVTRDQLAPILRDLGAAEPIAITELAGGGSQVFRIDLARGAPLTLKTYDDATRSAAAKEALMSSLLAHLDLPITRFMLLDESKSRLPYSFAITNHLAGEVVSSFNDEPDAAELYLQMGAMLRQVHTVRMPTYGFFSKAGAQGPSASNVEFLRNLAENAFHQFRHYGADPLLAARLEEIFYDRLDAMSFSRGPVFAHDDFRPNNVLAARGADGRLRLTGLLDFGNALAADPVHDLAKALFVCNHDAPAFVDKLREGYGPIDHPDPEGALWFYTLLHRVIMWWFLRHIGVLAEGERSDLVGPLEEMAGSAV